MSIVLKDVTDVIDNYSGLSRKTLEYGLVTKSIVAGAAKEPGFSVDSWAPLADLIAVDDFVRVGNFKEVMNWTDYVGFLTAWAANADWDCSFKRITEVGNIVFLELEERSAVGEFKSVVNSLTVYEYDDNAKIRHLDVYLQMPLPEGDMFGSYDGVEISG
ncbi:UNVERIFIED_CONTAM: hypothetical protein DES50_107183 [Williamsia faeni]